MHQVIVIGTEEYPVVTWTYGHKTFVLILINRPIRMFVFIGYGFLIGCLSKYKFKPHTRKFYDREASCPFDSNPDFM